MVVLRGILRVNIQVVNAHWLGILSEFNIVQISGLLVDVVHYNEVVSDLHLVQEAAPLDLYALAIFECILGVQLVNENLTCLWAQVEHNGLVVKGCNE